MKYISACIVAAMLCSCSQKAILKPQEVKIPVSIPCLVTLPAEPAWNVPKEKSGKFPNQVAAIAADLDLAKGYIGELKSAINSCNASALPAEPSFLDRLMKV